jgi:hypothetical protein
MSDFHPLHIQLGRTGNRVYGEIRDGEGVRLASVWIPRGDAADASGGERNGDAGESEDATTTAIATVSFLSGGDERAKCGSD